MRESKLQDEAYSEVLELVESIEADISDIEHISDSVDIPDDLVKQIRIVIQRVDYLYLRNRSAESGDEKTINQIEGERDLYSAKLLQAQKEIERCQEALAGVLGIEQDSYRGIKEFVEELQTKIDTDAHEQLDSQSHREELNRVEKELDKIQEQRKKFREESEFIDTE